MSLDDLCYYYFFFYQLWFIYNDNLENRMKLYIELKSTEMKIVITVFICSDSSKESSCHLKSRQTCCTVFGISFITVSAASSHCCIVELDFLASKFAALSPELVYSWVWDMTLQADRRLKSAQGQFWNLLIDEKYQYSVLLIHASQHF